MCLSGLPTKGIIRQAVGRWSGFSSFCCHIMSRENRSGHLSDAAAGSLAGCMEHQSCQEYMVVLPLERAGIEVMLDVHARSPPLMGTFLSPPCTLGRGYGRASTCREKSNFDEHAILFKWFLFELKCSYTYKKFAFSGRNALASNCCFV